MGWNDAEGLERVDSLETCRAALLAVRKLLLIPALHPSVPVASRQRHHAAADAVLLLAHTSTFAVAQVRCEHMTSRCPTVTPPLPHRCPTVAPSLPRRCPTVAPPLPRCHFIVDLS